MSILGIISRHLPDSRLKRGLQRLHYRYLYELSLVKLVKVGHDYEKYYSIKKADTVVVLGAHEGLCTIIAARKVGRKGKVIAIEPQGGNLEVLKKNIKQARLKNVEIVPKGVWSQKGKMKLYCCDVSSAANLFGSDTGKFTLIEVDTLDNILRELQVDKVDFIEADIEGAEIEALKGAEETLKNNGVKLAIAAYHKVNGEQTYKTIMPKLEKMGYKTRCSTSKIVYGEKEINGETGL